MNPSAIISLISAHPGMYFSQIGRALGLPTGTLDYTLHRLAKQGSIHDALILGKRCYFPPSFSAAERALMGCLRDTTSRRIITLLIAKPMRNQDISSALTLSKSTISWHTQRLKSEGVINVKHGTLTLNSPSLAQALLITYRQSLVDRLSSNFSDLWA